MRSAAILLSTVLVLAPIHATAAERMPLGTAGRAGVGLLVFGALAIGGGGALIGVHQAPHLDPDNAQREIARLTRGPGIAMLVLGVAAAAGGGALVGIDRKAARAQIAPWLGRTGGGVTLSLRFGGRGR